MRLPSVLILAFLIVGITTGFKPKKDLELAKCKKKELVTHLAYSLVIDKPHRQAQWVAYQLVPEELNEVCKRNNKFIPDPLIPNDVALKEEYSLPYHKGHLAPADHMLFSDTVMQESFFMSNMGPQFSSLNQGKWKVLETQTGKWAGQYGSVYIISGPIFESVIDTIGNNFLVPSHYFKAVLVYTEQAQQAIGFIFPNKKPDLDLDKYAVSVDKIEKKTGLDLFTKLPNAEEKELEKKVDLSLWSL